MSSKTNSNNSNDLNDNNTNYAAKYSISKFDKKTKKEMIERSKKKSGLFDLSHTIAKTEVEKGAQNIEYLRNRNNGCN